MLIKMRTWKLNSILITGIIFAVFSLGITSCNQNAQKETPIVEETETNNSITEQEVLDAQKAWGEI